MAWLDEEELRKFRRVGRKVLISKHALIFGHENIEIGDNVRIDAQTILMASAGSIKIGSHVHVAIQCLLSGGGGIVLEDFTSVSMGAKLISASDDASGNYLVNPNLPSDLTKVARLPVLMAQYSWVGTNTVLLPGAQLSEGTVVGSCSLVTTGRILLPWIVYTGIPVAPNKPRRGREMIAKAEEARRRFERENPR